MDDRTMDSTFDPRQPWHVLMLRGEEWQVVATYETAVELIRAVGDMPNPQDVIVRHAPSERDGTGSSFLREVNRRMRHDG